jgi:hypothetical protein
LAELEIFDGNVGLANVYAGVNLISESCQDRRPHHFYRLFSPDCALRGADPELVSE